jgi:antitoxin ParD1/3/4
LAYIANKEIATMVTRNVVLTETQDQLVQALVASGRYQNVSEAMRAGLRLLEQEEAQLVGIRGGLLEGLQQAERGDLAEGSGADAVRRAFARARTTS